jgi:hypothetical protein
MFTQSTRRVGPSIVRHTLGRPHKSDADLGQIALRQTIRSEGKPWDVVAPRHSVTNPNPPWKTGHMAMCNCLAVSEALPTLDLAQS